jgi:hypothetical protein
MNFMVGISSLNLCLHVSMAIPVLYYLPAFLSHANLIKLMSNTNYFCQHPTVKVNERGKAL